YLLVSMLLGLIIVSGVLSEQSIRRVRVEPVLPDELFAGRLALFGARVVNRKRWWPSYSVSVEVLGVGQRAYLAKLPAGGERLITWPETPPARGRRRLAGFRVATRFPFGLFVKAGQLEPDVEVLVYPAVGPVSPDRYRELDVAGGGAAPPGSSWSGRACTSRSAAGPRSRRASSPRSLSMSPPPHRCRLAPVHPRPTRGSARSAWHWAPRDAPPGAPPRDAPPRGGRPR